MTLNQVIKRIETLALSHKQLNSFFFGDVVNFLTSKGVDYPACFVDMSSAGISKQDRQTTFNLRFWLCDLVNVSENAKDNELEVQSDLTSTAEDIIAMLNFTGYDATWDISETSPAQYYTEKFEDLVAALSFDVSISVRFRSDRCQVPSTLTFE